VNRDQPAAGIGTSHPQPELHQLADAAATRALGRLIASRWLRYPTEAMPLLLLKGDLGAGKTCLVQGLALGLGIEEPITSPTFALAQHYQGSADGRPTALIHLDLYRLEQPGAADELLLQELEEAMAIGALLAAEWPERLSRPPEAAWVAELTLQDGSNPDLGRLATVVLPPSGAEPDHRP
jgi:tRNA threonylcarbamoyladenosine biosynthesis protein TsaE